METRRMIRWATLGLGFVLAGPALAQAQLFPNLPIRRERVPVEMEDPRLGTFRRQYFGYYPTCWRRFPPGWTCPCPNPEMPSWEAEKAKGNPRFELPRDGEGATSDLPRRSGGATGTDAGTGPGPGPGAGGTGGARGNELRLPPEPPAGSLFDTEVRPPGDRPGAAPEGDVTPPRTPPPGAAGAAGDRPGGLAEPRIPPAPPTDAPVPRDAPGPRSPTPPRRDDRPGDAPRAEPPSALNLPAPAAPPLAPPGDPMPSVAPPAALPDSAPAASRSAPRRGLLSGLFGGRSRGR